MQKHYSPDDKPVDKDELIPLIDLFAPVWHARWLVLIITSAAMVCGVAWTLLNSKYLSHGFFQFGGAIPIVKEKNSNIQTHNDYGRLAYKDRDQEARTGIALTDFKKYAASYATSERFNEYVQEKKLSSVGGIDKLYKLFSTETGIPQAIEPVYAFTRTDAKVLMEQPKGSSNNIIGLRINYDDSSPEVAQQIVGLLGHYVMDSIVYLIYTDALRFKHDEIRIRMTQLEHTISNKKIQLEEYARKIADLEKILARNPTAKVQDTRQIIQITEESIRYLSPATLLTITEVEASEANWAILRAKNEQVQNALLLEYYDRVKSILDTTKSGETILRSLEPVKATVFKEKNLENNVIKAAHDMITVDNQSAITLYLEKSRFIAGPTLPSHSTARPARALAVSFMVGLLLSLLLVFGREWWRKNQTQMSG